MHENGTSFLNNIGNMYVKDLVKEFTVMLQTIKENIALKISVLCITPYVPEAFEF